MVAEGYIDRLMLSSDAARRSMWAIHGGLGLAWLATRFVEILGDLGVDERGHRHDVRNEPRQIPGVCLAFDGARLGPLSPPARGR